MLPNRAVLAPMTGITDAPFRRAAAKAFVHGPRDWNQAFGERGRAGKCIGRKELAEGKIILCWCDRVSKRGILGSDA